MIWATVTILTPCSAENFSRSGTRAIVPSSFMISQITPAGLRPAIRARSTAASVCPARCNTPPGRALRGKMWPGITRSSGPVDSSTATLQVCARSAAEMPVETPSLASMDTVKAVPMREELWVIICGISRRSRSSSAMGRQISPFPCVAIKLMSSGVTSSAAIVRSPSFSRSSSSQTMTILPDFMSSMISSMGLNGIFDAPLEVLHPHVRLEQPLHVLSNDVGLQVHAVADPQLPEVRVRAGLGQDGGGERGIAQGDDGEAYAVHADAPLFDGVAEYARGRLELPDLGLPFGIYGAHLAHPVHVPLNEVSPEPPLEGHRPLQVDGAPLREISERRAPEGLRHGMEGERLPIQSLDRQANAVHRHALAHARASEDSPCGDPQAKHLARLQGDDPPHLFNQPGEHDPPRGQDRALRPRPRPGPLPSRPRTSRPRPSSSRAARRSWAPPRSRRAWARK